MKNSFKFNESGSTVLRLWNEKRALEKAIHARGNPGRRNAWAAALLGGAGGAGFAGGAGGRLTGGMAGWSGAINADLDASLVTLRARARQLTQNTEFGRRFLALVRNNVIGADGPTLQVRAFNGGGVLDKPANDAIEIAWSKWRSQADLRGMLDLPQLERIGVAAVARDGETLIRIVRDRSLPNGIALQLLEADRLDESFNTYTRAGNRIRQGVEHDSTGRPVAYWVRSAHPGEAYNNTAGAPAAVERIPADQIIHAFLPVRAEQVRGYTWMHAVLIRMSMIHGYEEAAVVAARVGASKMGVFTNINGGGPVLDGIADGKSAEGIPQITAEAGEFIQAPEGWALESWNPEYPHANFESFLKACFRGVATGLDVAAHNLTGDMTDVNYSSARIAELAERDQWMVLQSWWFRVVSMRIYKLWLESALLRGEIIFPKSGSKLPAESFNKFAGAAKFQGRRWKWVDPGKETAANEKNIGLGLDSRTNLAASQGREFEDIVDELRQERAMLEAAGLPWEVGKVAAPAPVPVPDDDGNVDPDDPDGAAGGAGSGKKT